MYPNAELAWCRSLFRSLADHGVWGVPRSGLVFSREGEALVWTDRMPFDPEMPGDEADLRAYQDEDYAAIAARFEAAGIPVWKATS